MAKTASDFARDRKLSGLCGTCGNAALTGKSRCQPCADRDSERNRQRYLAKKAGTNCVMCSKEPKVAGMSCCSGCLEKQKAKQDVRRKTEAEDLRRKKDEERASLVTRQICYVCKNASVSTGRLVCEKCAAELAAKSVGSKMTENDKKRAAGRCVSCPGQAEEGRARCRPCADRRNDRIVKAREAGICRDCLAAKSEPGYVRCAACLARKNAQYAEQKAAGICTRCHVDPAIKDKSLCEDCRLILSEHVRKRAQKVKDATFAAYGGYKCAMCDETREHRLHLDHIKNDGNEHRRMMIGKNRGTGHQTYRWLQSNNFPPMMQVLCVGCHADKHHEQRLEARQLKTQKIEQAKARRRLKKRKY